jgi:hypothetical protein
MLRGAANEARALLFSPDARQATISLRIIAAADYVMRTQSR